MADIYDNWSSRPANAFVYGFLSPDVPHCWGCCVCNLGCGSVNGHAAAGILGSDAGETLAHEVGHVCAKHGLQSIKKSRLIDAFSLIGQEAARRYGPEELTQLANLFEGTLGDIVNTLILSGYDRKFEYEADAQAAKITSAAGYSQQGLVDFLKTMVGDTSTASGKGWFKTHPGPEQRIEKVRLQPASSSANLAGEPVRTRRFQQAVAGLK